MATEYSPKYSDEKFEEIIKEAEAAASKAAEECFEKLKAAGPRYSVHDASGLALDGSEDSEAPCVGYMLDVCGGGYISLREDRKRDPLYKYCRELEFYREKELGRNPTKKFVRPYKVPISYKLQGRQEMAISEAAIYAAYDVLKSYGLKNCYPRIYID